jgi:hypothetical protein
VATINNNKQKKKKTQIIFKSIFAEHPFENAPVHNYLHEGANNSKLARLSAFNVVGNPKQLTSQQITYFYNNIEPLLEIFPRAISQLEIERSR